MCLISINQIVWVYVFNNFESVKFGNLGIECVLPSPDHGNLGGGGGACGLAVFRRKSFEQ